MVPLARDPGQVRARRGDGRLVPPRLKIRHERVLLDLRHALGERATLAFDVRDASLDYLDGSKQSLRAFVGRRVELSRRVASGARPVTRAARVFVLFHGALDARRGESQRFRSAFVLHDRAFRRDHQLFVRLAYQPEALLADDELVAPRERGAFGERFAFQSRGLRSSLARFKRERLGDGVDRGEQVLAVALAITMLLRLEVVSFEFLKRRLVGDGVRGARRV